MKLIVRELDEVNGITHEHDVNYLKDMAFLALAEELTAAHGDDPACPSCGEIPAEKRDAIRVRVNPRARGINGEAIPLLSCFMCYLRSEGKI